MLQSPIYVSKNVNVFVYVFVNGNLDSFDLNTLNTYELISNNTSRPPKMRISAPSCHIYRMFTVPKKVNMNYIKKRQHYLYQCWKVAYILPDCWADLWCAWYDVCNIEKSHKDWDKNYFLLIIEAITDRHLLAQS